MAFSNFFPKMLGVGLVGLSASQTDEDGKNTGLMKLLSSILSMFGINLGGGEKNNQEAGKAPVDNHVLGSEVVSKGFTELANKVHGIGELKPSDLMSPRPAIVELKGYGKTIDDEHYNRGVFFVEKALENHSDGKLDRKTVFNGAKTKEEFIAAFGDLAKPNGEANHAVGDAFISTGKDKSNKLLTVDEVNGDKIKLSYVAFDEGRLPQVHQQVEFTRSFKEIDGHKVSQFTSADGKTVITQDSPTLPIDAQIKAKAPEIYEALDAKLHPNGHQQPARVTTGEPATAQSNSPASTPTQQTATSAEQPHHDKQPVHTGVPLKNAAAEAAAPLAYDFNPFSNFNNATMHVAEPAVKAGKTP